MAGVCYGRGVHVGIVEGSGMSDDLRTAIERANNDILAALDRLAKELPWGIVIADVDVDTLDVGRVGGKVIRQHRVRISLEMG